ncbi:MAG: M20/M25/M40 family metallo-hydrolase [Planctomycetes bacterium]|nr:M20/M25/M40 family metallo-hydrolase [Planctomycetota bacterium]
MDEHGMDKDFERAVAFARERARSVEMRAFFIDLLRDLIAIDTTPRSDIASIAANEEACFARIRAASEPYLPARARVARIPIPVSIEAHPEYTLPHYTRTSEHPEVLSAVDAYRGRGNLVISVPGRGAGGKACIYDAHIDTVPPHIPPRIDADRVWGRGACDDKGGAALAVAGLRILGEIETEIGLATVAGRTYYFVIDEETGGNGSLALAGSESGADAVMLEPTRLVPHDAGRGAVWYQVRLARRDGRLALAHLAARVILALEEEGARIKAESRHPLFRPENVQTCQGVLGPYGVHPSAVNDYAAFEVGAPRERVEGLLAAPLAAYIDGYGDKTAETDDATGEPKVRRHIALAAAGGGSTRLEVFGKAGHMGAIHRCDCALVKAAHIIAALEEAGIRSELEWHGGDEILLEGGQGFLPTHAMQDIMRRLSDAAARGAAEAAKRAGLEARAAIAEMRLEKLHNDAYESPPDCAAMRGFRAAYEAFGRPWPATRGLEVSCDARLFHKAGHCAVVFGPGSLAQAHAADEHLIVDEAIDALEIHVAAALAAGGIAHA